jgi:hypothetical protein
MAGTGAGQGKGRRGGLGWITGAWLVALVVTAGYTAWWFVLARQIEARAGAVLGPGVAIADLSVGGWPYRLSVTARNVTARLPGDARLKAARIGVTTSPFAPQLWILDGIENATLALPGGPERRIVTGDLKSSLRVNRAGQLERLSVEFQSITALSAGTGAGSGAPDPGWSIGRGSLHLVHDPAQPQRFAFMTDLKEIRLSAVPQGPAMILGTTITHARVAGPISEASAFTTSLEAWRAAGGRFDVMAGELLWGPLSFSGVQGSLALNAAGRPEGAVRGTGALKPEGVALEALTAPVAAQVVDGRLEVLGLSVLALPGLR